MKYNDKRSRIKFEAIDEQRSFLSEILFKRNSLLKKRLYNILVFSIFFQLLTTSIACKKKPIFTQETKLTDLVDHRLLKAVGIKVPELPPKTFHPKLRGFISEFIADAKKYGVHITDSAIDKLRIFDYVDNLSIGDSPGVMASCNRYFTSQETLSGETTVTWLTIEVLRNATQDYTGSSLILLREICYHELFHCFLNKGHLPSNIPGIMNPIFNSGDKRAITDWDGLVRDMFSADFIKMIPDAS